MSPWGRVYRKKLDGQTEAQKYGEANLGVVRILMEGPSSCMFPGHPNLTLFATKRTTGVSEGNTGAEQWIPSPRGLVDSQVYLKNSSLETDPQLHLQIEDNRYPVVEAQADWTSGNAIWQTKKTSICKKNVFSRVWIIFTGTSLCLGTVSSLTAQMVYFQPCSRGTLPPFPKPYSSAISQSLLGLNSLPFHCPSLIRKSVSCGLG